LQQFYISATDKPCMTTAAAAGGGGDGGLYA